MSKKEKKIEAEEEVKDEVVETPEEEATETPVAEKKTKDTSITVNLSNGVSRTYSLEKHGENFEELAKEFELKHTA